VGSKPHRKLREVTWGKPFNPRVVEKSRDKGEGSHQFRRPGGEPPKRLEGGERPDEVVPSKRKRRKAKFKRTRTPQDYGNTGTPTVTKKTGGTVEGVCKRE